MISEKERTAGLWAITITQFALVFMLSSVAVAIPSLGAEFGATAAQLGLVESGYISAVAMLLFPVTRLADMIGRGFVFVLGVTVFTVFSLIIPLSHSIEQLNALRMFQGAGGAMMVTTGLAILADLFPGQRRAMALGIASAGVYVGLSAGPWLGGMIATEMGWRAIFYIGAVPCVLCLIMVIYVLPVKPVRKKCPPFDFIGAILCALGMLLLAQGGSHFHNITGKSMLLGGLLSLTAFVFWERRTKAPLLDMTLFSENQAFALGSTVQFISYAATFGITFLISLYLQVAQGMTPGQAGMILMAQPIMQTIFSPVSGKLCQRWAPHNVATAGMALATVALGGAIFLEQGAPIWFIALVLGACGTGNAIFATANTAVIMDAVEKEHYGIASAMVAGMRTTGMTVSLVFISAVLATMVGPTALHAKDADLFVHAMNVSFIALTAISALGILLSARAKIRQRKAVTSSRS
ncbi:MFS transporter [Pseudodesulfovibrio sediminis]|uniref:MFS transporter n=1 Tax=Pseudodesulfovibrio sediminis TaxID=2810563 RepID=A0ABM7P9G0_9BACT|nr:MFS transporter [Pseudodesulfovibrio sediminis]BCS90046.1 MFS transporter [Pseudodesulfovibrio sediminis]